MSKYPVIEANESVTGNITSSGVSIRSNVLEARGLAIGYIGSKKKKVMVREHLDFALYAGEMVCLLGPNGAGKSTLLRTLAFFQPPLAGELLCEGKPLTAYSERERSRKIGVVLTDKTQTGGLTVYELVALGRQPHTGFFGRLKPHDHEAVQKAIAAVGITHKVNSYVAELSDGERQKAMIAKALVQECPLILLDEPTAFLDVVSRIEIMQLLHTIAREQGRTVLLSTHDVEQALAFADRLWLLSPGNMFHCGVTEDLIFDGSMERLFPQNTLCFDPKRGGYTPISNQGKQLVVDAKEPLLSHWIMNALLRNGYVGIPCEEALPESPVLVVRSPQDMELRTPSSVYPLHSFAELIELLNA